MNMRLLLAGAALTTLLAACDRKPEKPADAGSSISIGTAPEQVSDGAPLDVGLAPSAPQALPAAAPAPVYDLPPTEEEAYWQEAQDYYDEYADAPPDYVYDYGEEAPAAWLNGALVRMVVERLAGGGERYYYYRGNDDRPYFVRDPDYWYGYRDGRLVSVYDYRNRRPLAREETRRRAEWAGRYAVRAEELRRAARRAENAERKPIDRGQWQSWQRRDDIRERREDRDRRDRERPREERPDQARPPVVTPQPQRPLEPSPGRPDRPRDERPDRGDRPDRAEQPQRPETRPDRPARPERPERPEQAERPDRGERPQRPAERPERPERPRAETPREQPQRPDRSERPERPRPERPAPAAKPAPQPEAKPAEARPAPKPKPERPARERGQGERQAPDPQ